MMHQWENNADTLQTEMLWVKEITDTCIANDLAFDDIGAPIIQDMDVSAYANMVRKYGFSAAERFVFTLALIPHFLPHLLDVLLEKNPETGNYYTFIGGKNSNGFKGFIPTGETAIHILGGRDLKKRFSYLSLFDSSHAFATNGLLYLESAENGDPYLSGALTVPDEIIDMLGLGITKEPKFSNTFPAEQLHTNLQWEDLVMNEDTAKELQEIESWIEHHKTMMEDWGMSKKLKQGYRALFYGPPGTGKSLTAALIGQKTNKPVYRIDLSMVVSKYIGETEKNLANVFNKAENKEWILFFDEADALFGKRTNVSDAHDRYANQEVSYLLQRIESYNGLVILASNMKNNIDQAFMRRFQSVVYFPVPKPEERLLLWQQCFSPMSSLEKNINLMQIAQTYELAGGSIINVVQYSSLMALKRNTNQILLTDLIDGIKKEYHKAGKTL